MEQLGFDHLPEVLRQLFEKVEHIEAMLEEIKFIQPETDEHLSIDEAAVYLKITKAALYAMTSRRLIPFYKPGKRLYFSKSDLDAWVNQAKNKTSIQIIAENKHRFRR